MKEADDWDTVLPFKESQKVEHAVKLAYAAELARCKMEAALRGDLLVFESGLLSALTVAKNIINTRAERADDMGG